MRRLLNMPAGARFLLALVLAAPAVVVLDSGRTGAPAYAQSNAVRDIRVVGNKRIEPETVRSYLTFSVGDAYDAGKVDASLRALFATGLFADVRIDREGSTVVVTVVENPSVNQVAFEGNSEVDTDTLRAEVQLKPRSVFTRAKAQADVQRILDVYQRQGRFAASVDPQIIELEQNRVNVVFVISEGGATKVKGIHFIGNHAFSDEQLRDIISTTQSGWFDFLKGTNVYDPDRLNLDRELLRQYYLKNGYADARVVAANAELDVDGSGFFINFTIEEGPQYDFGAVSIESSFPDLNTESLRSDLLVETGDTYNAGYIDKDVEKLTLSASEQGFAFARVRPKAVPDAANHTIGIVYVVDEGPRIYIERINIVGNTRTKDYVIRREFRLAEGDAYNPALVDRAKKRLQALGLFKNVDIKRRPGSAEDRVVLDVQVEEQQTGELSFGAGYSTSEGLIGDVSLTERNLLGNGQFIRLSLSGSFERLQAQLSFTEPRFLDMNLAAGFDLFHKEVDQTSSSGFSSRNDGGTLRLGFPLAENLWMQTSYSLTQSGIFNVQGDASPVVKDAEGDFLTSAFGAALTYDKRNHPKNPTSGVYFQLGTDFAGAGGDVRYIRVQAEGRYYYPISEKLTFVSRVTAGQISGWGGEDVRLVDLFFRGGETIRGFETGGFGPRDLGSTNRDALGGQTYWAATAEVRFPLPLLPEDLGIGGAVFADAGSLFDASARAKALAKDLADDATVRSSVGGSVIWDSPLGPLRLDVAHVLTKEKYDQEQIVRFGAQTKF